MARSKRFWHCLCWFNFRWIPENYSRWMAWLTGLTLFFGLAGFLYEYFSEDKPWRDASVAFYRTLQLFLLNSGAEHGPWGPLTLARCSAAVAFILLSWTVISSVGWDYIARARRARLKGHVVICGLGRIGKQLIDQITAGDSPPDVIVVEPNRQNPWLRYALERGVDVLHGDATESEILREAQVAVASRIYVVTGDDGANLEAATEAAELVATGRAGFPTKIFVHLVDSNLATTYAPFARNQAVGPRVFNVMRNSANQLIRDPLFLSQTPCKPEEVVHYFLVGFGPMGQTLAVQLALLGHFPNCKRPRFTVFDREIEKVSRDFVARYNRFTAWNDGSVGVEKFRPERDFWTWDEEPLPPPLATDGKEENFAIDYVANAQFLPLPADAGDERFAALIADSARKPGVKPIILICSLNDHGNFDLAVRLKERLDALGCRDVHYFVWLPRQPALEKVLNREDRMHAFGSCETAVASQDIEDPSREYFGRLLHYAYERSRERKAAEKGAPYQRQEWDSLPDFKRESNLQAADYLPVRLWAIGYKLVVLPRDPNDPSAPQPTGLEFPGVRADTLRVLAEMEHHRWTAERLLSGWRFGPQRDDDCKRQPLLIPFEKLPRDYQDIDIDLTRAALREAQKHGYSLQKTLNPPCLPID